VLFKEKTKLPGCPSSGKFLFEAGALKDLVLSLDGELRKKGGEALIFPGHGEYYLARELNAKWWEICGSCGKARRTSPVKRA
jgi:hypothetical protein